MKKTIQLVLVLLLVFAMTSAVAEYSEVYNAVLPISDEVIEYTIWVKTAANEGHWNDLWYTKFVEETMGIRLNGKDISEAGWTEEVSLAFGTGDLPDCFAVGLSDIDAVKYGSQGQLIDLAPLIDEYAPNIKALFDAYPNYREAITCPDGAIYYFKGLSQTERELLYSRVYYNMQWLENVGKDVPETLDDLLDVLRAFKEQDANDNGDYDDEIPIGGIYVLSGSDYRKSVSYLVLNALGFYDQLLDVSEDGIVRFVPTDDNYIEYLKYMRTLVEEELIDSEYFTQDNTMRSSKTAAGLYGVLVTTGANWSEMKDEALYSQYEMQAPLKSDLCQDGYASARDLVLTNGFAITNKCTNPIPLVKFLDVIMTEQGSIDEQQGVALGDYLDDGGYVLRTDENGTYGMDLVYPTDEYSSYNNFRSALITRQELPYYWPWSIPLHIRFNAQQVDLTEQITRAFVPHYHVAFPSKMMTPDEANELSVLKTELESYLWQTEVKIMKGELDLEAGFAELKQGLIERGSERYAEIYQGIYDR